MFNVQMLQLHLLMLIGLLTGMVAWLATLARATANSTIRVVAVAVAHSFSRYLPRTTAAGSFDMYVLYTRAGQLNRPDISWLPGITLASASNDRA